jgi:hypothetical protein
MSIGLHHVFRNYRIKSVTSYKQLCNAFPACLYPPNPATETQSTTLRGGSKVPTQFPAGPDFIY